MQIIRDSRKSRQKSGKNTAYFEKNREKHGKNTASKYDVFSIKIINVNSIVNN